jgi:hypothetical protein
MRLGEILCEGVSGNAYYEVEASFPIYVVKGHRLTQFHYGASQIGQPTYNEVRTEDGDQLHFLIGGLFYVKGDTQEAFLARLTPPDEFGPMRKNHSGIHRDSNLYHINWLLEIEYVRSIPKEAAMKTDYNKNR